MFWHQLVSEGKRGHETTTTRATVAAAAKRMSQSMRPNERTKVGSLVLDAVGKRRRRRINKARYYYYMRSNEHVYGMYACICVHKDRHLNTGGGRGGAISG